MKMFKIIQKDKSFPEIEKEILEFWEGNSIFEQSLAKNKDKPPFVFYDGPPFATGLPHYGNLLAGVIKDIVPRYWTMRGYYVERRFGWDCHGLPVENEIEKKLRISGKKDIEKYGIDRFNEECRKIVLRYTREWEKTVRRIGRWVDFKNDYKTMDRTYMESIMWVFKQLWEKDLIYNGYRVQPYCPRCSTPLANFETNQGYMDVQDPSITIHLPLIDKPGVSVLVWTTTPWTLPSNVAVAVGKDIDYVEIKDKERNYILAEERLPVYYKNLSELIIVKRFKGAEIIGNSYTPVFDFFMGKSSDFFRIVEGDFVNTEEGTGLVHMAPAFGEDDYEVSLMHKWPIVCPVDDEGKFTNEVKPYEGMEVKKADKKIISDLKTRGSLIHQSTIQHSYPHCYRCDSPLIYKAISTWFCRIGPLKDNMLRNNLQIHWIPEHLQTGRFGKWLENARDWNLSRNRYWGAPIPVWRCKNGHLICLGSIQEMEERSGKKIDDLHKHHIDKLVFKCGICSEIMERIPEVLDCWFESGSMPYAQQHYPFENKCKVEQGFPADFIAEGLDQTRGWFYTLLVISTALFNKPPFRNVVVNGIILAEDGKKMSKRLKNYPDPDGIISKYGADALRLFMINSPVVRAEDLYFSEKGILEVMRSVLIPFWNAYQFFIVYAEADMVKGQLNWKPGDSYQPSSNELDRWIISSMQSLILCIENEMAAYHLDRVVPVLVRFVDNLTNWYIRRSRGRFWSKDNDSDKNHAYSTLYEVLITSCKILAPFLPFLPESIYRSLISPLSDNEPISVHLCDFPCVQKLFIDKELEQKMELVHQVVFLGRSLRAGYKIRNRQPLRSLRIITKDLNNLKILQNMENLILEELNIKEIIYASDDRDLVTLSAKPNYKALGKIYGKEMKKAASIIEKFDRSTIAKLENGKTVAVLDIELDIESLQIQRKAREDLLVKSFNDLTIVLDSKMDKVLLQEGLANEVINRIQNLRKKNGFQLSDSINIEYLTDNSDINEVISVSHQGYIRDAVIAMNIIMAPDISCAQDTDINGDLLRIKLSKA
ncbi:MAG: isoleucine--tRNA ligase [bacterium]